MACSLVLIKRHVKKTKNKNVMGRKKGTPPPPGSQLPAETKANHSGFCGDQLIGIFKCHQFIVRTDQ